MMHSFFLRLITSVAAGSGPDCSKSSFLGFPTWYKYLSPTNQNGLCTPHLDKLSDIWLVVAAVIEILLRLAALVAVFAVLYGGILYVTSSGEPEKTTKARATLTNGLVGLVIAVIATATVVFIAGRFATS